jgi:hypothetical protein
VLIVSGEPWVRIIARTGLAIADVNVLEQVALVVVLYAWVYRFTMDHQFQLVAPCAC